MLIENYKLFMLDMNIHILLLLCLLVLKRLRIVLRKIIVWRYIIKELLLICLKLMIFLSMILCIVTLLLSKDFNCSTKAMDISRSLKVCFISVKKVNSKYGAIKISIKVSLSSTFSVKVARKIWSWKYWILLTITPINLSLHIPSKEHYLWIIDSHSAVPSIIWDKSAENINLPSQNIFNHFKIHLWLSLFLIFTFLKIINGKNLRLTIPVWHLILVEMEKWRKRRNLHQLKHLKWFTKTLPIPSKKDFPIILPEEDQEFSRIIKDLKVNRYQEHHKDLLVRFLQLVVGNKMMDFLISIQEDENYLLTLLEWKNKVSIQTKLQEINFFLRFRYQVPIIYQTLKSDRPISRREDQNKSQNILKK